MLTRKGILMIATLLLLALVPGARCPYRLCPRQAQAIAQGRPTTAALASALDHAQAMAAVQNTSMMFIENVGQFADGARFQVRGSARTLWLTEDGLWVTVMEPTDRETQEATRQGYDRFSPSHFASSPSQQELNLKLGFVGANPHPRLEPFNRLDIHVSYLVGDDPDNWHADVPVWGGVRYVDLYPGVDLVVRAGIDPDHRQPQSGQAQGASLSQHLEVRDDADLSVVRLRVEGADTLTLDGDCLRLTTAVGDFTLPLLTVEDAMPNDQPAIFAVEPGTFEISFPFFPDPSLFRSSAPVVSLSPQDNPSDLLYSTFMGGSNDERGSAIAVDGAGSVYITGRTDSLDFPTTAGAFDGSHGGYGDAFVVKLNISGTGLAYATFLGGSGSDHGRGIAVDEAGSAYVAGWTGSCNFPTTEGAFDTSYDSGDAFVVKLSADGTELAYATFLGGGGYQGDYGNAISVDGAGCAYVAGSTDSADFPTTEGAFDTIYNGGDTDVFVVKLNADGTGLTYSTFLGGSGRDCYFLYDCAISVDGAGSAYITGSTDSTDFPTTAGAFDADFGSGRDAFVVKLDTDGTELAYATLLGGSDDDWGNAIALDVAGNAYVAGTTSSSDFPTTAGAFDTSYNSVPPFGWPGGDAFVAKVNADGTELAYSTFLGGSDDDYGQSIIVDRAGSAYVMGRTGSSDFPTTAGALDTSLDGTWDAFVVKLNVSGTDLAYATFLGGSGSDCYYHYGDYVDCAIVVDGAGNAYVAGTTSSSDFPITAGALDTSFNGGNGDAFVAKLAVVECKRIYLPVVLKNFNTSSPTPTPSPLTPTPGTPTPHVIVTIDPPSSEVALATTTCVVDIRIENVTDLYGAEVCLTFAPALLEVVDTDPDTEGVQIQPGTFLGPDSTVWENLVDQEAGEIYFSQEVAGEPVSGSGVLAAITFQGKAIGTSDLNFDEDCVFLYDYDGEQIAAGLQGGSVTVIMTSTWSWPTTTAEGDLPARPNGRSSTMATTCASRILSTRPASMTWWRSRSFGIPPTCRWWCASPMQDVSTVLIWTSAFF